MNTIDLIKLLVSANEGNQEKGNQEKPDLATDLPYKVGDKVFIQTVTNYYIGEISAINGNFVQLSKASWIQDTGTRLADFLTKGVTSETEFEPIKEGKNSINMLNSITCLQWYHNLPTQESNEY